MLVAETHLVRDQALVSAEVEGWQYFLVQCAQSHLSQLCSSMLTHDAKHEVSRRAVVLMPLLYRVDRKVSPLLDRARFTSLNLWSQYQNAS